MRSESGINWTDELRGLEREIYPGRNPERKSKRVHIDDLQMAWAVYLKSLERPAWWRRWWRAKNG